MEAKIDSRRHWNNTRIGLKAGGVYRFRSTGWWADFFVPCGASGYSSKVLQRFESKRRAANAKWFSLIGCVDKDLRTMFDIGALLESGESHRSPVTGVLYCFANDLPGMYWNNLGSVTLEVLKGSQDGD